MEAAQPLRSSAGVVNVIESRSASASAPEQLLIRVGIHNGSSRPVVVRVGAPWSTARLVVTTENGTLVQPKQRRDYRDYVSTRQVTLRPRQTWYASWEGQEWWSIDHWGYQLTERGNYKITNDALITGPFLEQRHSMQGSSIRVTIRQ